MPNVLSPVARTYTADGHEIRLHCFEGDVTKLISELAIHKLDVVLSDTPMIRL